MNNSTTEQRANDSAVVKFTDPKDVLIAARKLIEKPDNWTQGVYSRANKICGVAYCADGALMAAAGANVGPIFLQARDPLINVMGGIIGFNDTHTHAEVLAAFDKAIELAGAAKIADAVGDRESVPASTLSA